MNKIMFEHYPASKLPEDLREGLEKDAKVRIVIEAESSETEKEDLLPGFRHLRLPEPKPMTVQELRESIRRIKVQGRPSVSMEEGVARIRALRDEWDD